MLHEVLNDDGNALAAVGELSNEAFVLQSRGGTIGTANERNRDYSIALRLIIRRLGQLAPQWTGDIWVDSAKVQSLAWDERKVLKAAELTVDSESLFTLVRRRMQAIGRSPTARSKTGNSNKRLRVSLPGQSASSIKQALGLREAVQPERARLSSEMLRRVTPEHIFKAIYDISQGSSSAGFGDSSKYDLIVEGGSRLAPKAVFGRAATIALGFEVQPQHFSAGDGHSAFQVLREAGYQIVPKDADYDEPADLTLDDMSWTEGREYLVSHLRKERARGLAAAKRAEFKRLHGKLFCELCLLDPVVHFEGEFGEACIEIHHSDTMVQNMAVGHITRLEHLQCLCANCHRVLHRRMKETGKSRGEL